ncbi:MAG: two-component regulator propeller domain-containing protein [Flammeovirgaceae bacterium]
MIKYIRYSLLVSMLLLAEQVSAQLLPDHLHFNHIGVDEGLSNSNTTCIAQDAQGFIWIGTISGLFRYDGLSIKKFTHDAKNLYSLSTNYIFHIYASKQGGVWVATDNGLNYFDPELNRFQRWFFSEHEINQSQQYPFQDYYRYVFEATDGTVWLSIFEQGLLRFNPKTDEVRYWSDTQAPLNQYGYGSIVAHPNGQIWFGGQGLTLFDAEKQQMMAVDSLYPPLQKYQQQEVEALHVDRQGHIWVSSLGELVKFNPETNAIKIFKDLLGPNNPYEVSGIQEDRAGRFWLATAKGLYCFHPDYKQIQYYRHDPTQEWSLSSDALSPTILEDKQGLLWITSDAGVDQLDPLSFAFEHLVIPNQDALPTGNIDVFTLDQKQQLWLVNNRGICKYNPYTRQYTPVSPLLQQKLPRLYTYDLEFDTKENLWIAQPNQIIQYHEASNQVHYWFRTVEDFYYVSALQLDADAQGRMWLATWGAGLVSMKSDFGQLTQRNWDENSRITKTIDDLKEGERPTAYNLKVLANRKVWLSTTEGVSLLDPVADTIHFFKHNKANSSTIADDTHQASFFVDAQGKTWIGTQTGLNLFDSATNTFKRYGAAQNLSTTGILAIQEDDSQKLWLNTREGIYSFDPIEEKAQYYQPFDGFMTASALNAAKDSMGHIYYAIHNGVVRFQPNRVQRNEFLPSVIFTDFLLFNKSVKDSLILPKSIHALDQITLKHNQYIFSFEFVAMNLRQPHRNLYKYKMVGLSDEWIETDAKNPRATFTNLDAGTYTFMVKAANDEGLWNETPTTIQVVVLPPWYLTWWAKSIWVILIIGSAFSFYFWRVTTLKQQKLILEQQVEARTEEISNQKEEILQQAEELKTSNEKLIQLDRFKDTMSGMIAHDLKNPLGVIIQTENVPDSANQMAQQMLQLVNNMLDVQKYEQTELQLKKEALDLSQLVQDAFEQVQLLALAKHIQFTNQIEQGIAVLGDQSLLHRVFINFFTNAIKYSANNGLLEVSATPQENKQVQIAIRDEGQGIAPDQIEHIFQAFGQIDPRQSGVAASTGLGLTFCQLVVQAHDSEIQVTSKLGKGTTFYFNLQQTDYQLLDPTNHQSSVVISLTNEDRQALHAYYDELKEIKLHRALKIQAVVEKIKQEYTSTTLQAWGKALLDAAYNYNQAYYDELLGQIEKKVD